MVAIPVQHAIQRVAIRHTFVPVSITEESGMHTEMNSETHMMHHESGMGERRGLFRSLIERVRAARAHRVSRRLFRLRLR